MLPKFNALEKTSIELRRAINRLHLFVEQNPYDENVEAVNTLLDDLKRARTHIPKHLRDPDLENRTAP